MKKILLIFGIMVLLVGCSNGNKTETNVKNETDAPKKINEHVEKKEEKKMKKEEQDKFKLEAYDRFGKYMETNMVFSDKKEIAENVEFFKGNLDLFPSKKSDYEKYIDQSVNLESMTDSDDFKTKVLFKGGLTVTGVQQKKSEESGMFETIVEIDYSEPIIFSILIISDKETDIKPGYTLDIAGLPCVIYNNVSINEKSTESIYDKEDFNKKVVPNIRGYGGAAKKLIFAVSTDYKIVDKGN